MKLKKVFLVDQTKSPDAQWESIRSYLWFVLFASSGHRAVYILFDHGLSPLRIELVVPAGDLSWPAGEESEVIMTCERVNAHGTIEMRRFHDKWNVAYRTAHAYFRMYARKKALPVAVLWTWLDRP